MKNLKRDFKNNMTKQEAKAMNDLLNDDTIILRSSDKGSGIAIMDADKYKDEIESDLNDNTTYKQIDDRVILKTENKIKKLIEEMYKRNSVSKEMKAYLLPEDARPGRVQGNPKIHKNNHPLRVIINGQHTTTENIVEFIESELS